MPSDAPRERPKSMNMAKGKTPKETGKAQGKDGRPPDGRLQSKRLGVMKVPTSSPTTATPEVRRVAEQRSMGTGIGTRACTE